MKKIEIRKASSNDKSVIVNLIQLYLYDMSKYYPECPISNDGLYEYNMMEQFWQHPYLFYYGEELAGFCFVIDACPITQEKECWFMAEFFVLQNYRRKGISLEIAQNVIEMHKGKWHLGVITKNIIATKFWHKMFPNSPIKNYSHDGEDWKLFEVISN